MLCSSRRQEALARTQALATRGTLMGCLRPFRVSQLAKSGHRRRSKSQWVVAALLEPTFSEVRVRRAGTEAVTKVARPELSAYHAQRQRRCALASIATVKR